MVELHQINLRTAKLANVVYSWLKTLDPPATPKSFDCQPDDDAIVVQQCCHSLARAEPLVEHAVIVHWRVATKIRLHRDE